MPFEPFLPNVNWKFTYENWMESPLPNVTVSVPVAMAVEVLVAFADPASVMVAFPNGVAVPVPVAW